MCIHLYKSDTYLFLEPENLNDKVLGLQAHNISENIMCIVPLIMTFYLLFLLDLLYYHLIEIEQSVKY